MSRVTRSLAVGVAFAAVGLTTILPTFAAPFAAAANQRGEWLAGDLHVHTTYSHDSYGGPSDDNTGPDQLYTLGHSTESQFLVAASRGLDYLAITDHDDVRSQSDPGFGAGGVIPVPGYEASLDGHAQMLGAQRVLDGGDESAETIEGLSRKVRARPWRGIFQANHPANGSLAFPDDIDWGYGYRVRPDSVEIWNISPLYQPPLPSASSNEDATRYWEGWLDRGERIAATGGSDNHYLATTAAQGAGQPTTWVYTRERSASGVLRGLDAGRTFISAQPPGLRGPRVFLEADGDRDGRFGQMVGDRVAQGARLRVRGTQPAAGLLRVVVDGGREPFEPVPVGRSFEHRFRVPKGTSWVRAELLEPDAAEARAACDGAFGEDTTYCRNRLGLLAQTSAIFIRR